MLAYLFYQYVLPHFNRVIKSVTNAWKAAALRPFLCLERKTPVLGNERANSSCVSELVPHHKVQVRNVGENVLSLHLISLLARLHFCWVLHDNLNFAQSLYTFQRAFLSTMTPLLYTISKIGGQMSNCSDGMFCKYCAIMTLNTRRQHFYKGGTFYV